MLKQKERQIGVLAVALAVVFTVGLVMGTVALYYAPKSAVKDATEAIVLNNELTFFSLFKKNLIFELIWLLLLWVSGIGVVTAPLMAAVISLRGFVIGFTVSFMLKGNLSPLNLFLCSILPQCLTALPALSLFVITCSQSCDKRNRTKNSGTYFLYGLLFALITVVICVIETWLMIIFEKLC